MWFIKGKSEKLNKAKPNGKITPAQEEELNKMAELEKHLESMKLNDETIDVSGEVMRKIYSQKKVREPNQIGLSIFDRLFNPSTVRYAVILLCGIIIGTAVTWSFMAENSESGNRMISGSISDSKQGISFSDQNVSIKMVPYQIDNIYYLNFIIDSKNEIQMDVTFDEADVILKKADYTASERNPSISFDVGAVHFSANGKTSFQIIIEKVNDHLASVNVTANQDQSILMVKQIFFD